MSTKRTYLDPIHQDIILDRAKPAERLVMDLIDTKEFQRLRRVHQLGASFFTFQGAEGSRFTHSVGVMHVASKLIDMLRDRSPGIEEKRPLILSAALLHDIGHGPFSHVTEKILNYDHEDWSCKIIGGDTDVCKVLEAFDKNLAKDVVSVLKKTYHPKYISHMVSSQLDCDRFDYLLRDSYMTGTAYGLFALHRILASMELDEENERIIVSGDKGQIAVEDYLFARYSMYAQVYYHRKNLAARCLIAKLVKRARFLMESGQQTSFMDDATEKWLKGIDLTVAEYLTLDDVQMTYHIKRWSLDSDPILADLASRFLNRRLFKAMKIFRPRSLPRIHAKRSPAWQKLLVEGVNQLPHQAMQQRQPSFAEEAIKSRFLLERKQPRSRKEPARFALNPAWILTITSIQSRREFAPTTIIDRKQNCRKPTSLSKRTVAKLMNCPIFHWLWMHW